MNGRRSLRRLAHRPQESPSPPSEMFVGIQQHHPYKPEDIYRTRRWLQHASSHRLPNELLKSILCLADYDCVHFVASTGDPALRSSWGPETPAEPYVETKPLKFLKHSPSSADNPDRPYGKIRGLRVQANGKDQGWASNMEGGSWTWFELGKRRSGDTQVQRGPIWARNTIAMREWQAHKLEYGVDGASPSADINAWVDDLQAGDCISVVPMACFPGWACNVMEASIDVEVEVWR